MNHSLENTRKMPEYYGKIKNKVTFNRARHTATIRCYIVYAYSETRYAYRLRTSRLPDDVLKSLETETGIREFLRENPDKFNIIACPDPCNNVRNDYDFYLHNEK